MEIQKFKKSVIAYAEAHHGEEEEKGNSGFKNKAFQLDMLRIGWRPGWAWCIGYCEACWTIPSYRNKSDVFALMTDHFSANAVKTFENFKNDISGFFEVTRIPVPGDIAIFEKRRGGEPVKKGIWTLGHAALVMPGINEATFNTSEGNSNEDGSREGKEVAERTRGYNWFTKDGLALIGFIHCKIDEY